MERFVELEEMNIGGVLDKTFRTYFRNFLRLVLLVLLGAVPFIVLAMVAAVLLFLADFQEDADALGFGLVGLAILGGFVYLVSILMVFGATTVLVSNDFRGRPVSIIDAYRRVFKRLFTLIASQLLVGLVIGGIAFVLFMIAGLAGVVLGPFFILLLFPIAILVLIALIFFLLVLPTSVLEERAVMDTVMRGVKLLEGHRIEAVVVIFVLGMLTNSITYGIQYGTLGLVMIAGMEESGALAVSLTILSSLLSGLIGVMLMPLTAIATTLLYYNNRIRKEGFDLEHLAESTLDDDEGPDAAY